MIEIETLQWVVRYRVCRLVCALDFSTISALEWYSATNLISLSTTVALVSKSILFVMHSLANNNVCICVLSSSDLSAISQAFLY